MAIPDSVRELTLFIDADAGGHVAEQKSRVAHVREGRLILTQRPAIEGQDWNDVLAASSGLRCEHDREERALDPG